MESNLPARRDDAPLVVDTSSEMHPAGEDPQRPRVQQNVAVALIPLAVIVLLVLAFVAAAWTFLAALPAA